MFQLAIQQNVYLIKCTCHALYLKVDCLCNLQKIPNSLVIKIQMHTWDCINNKVDFCCYLYGQYYEKKNYANLLKAQFFPLSQIFLKKYKKKPNYCYLLNKGNVQLTSNYTTPITYQTMVYDNNTLTQQIIQFFFSFVWQLVLIS